MKKAILVIMDGLPDRPNVNFDRKTPLEVAKTPNLDKFTQMGISGVMDTIDIGVCPGSDTAHLALFGYDPYSYYTGRGPFEAAGIDMDLEAGDVAFRTNIGTVDEDLKIIDRRAGRIDDCTELLKDLNGTVIDGVKILIKAGLQHRAALVLRGENLSPKVSDGDLHTEGIKPEEIKPTDNTTEAEFTANVLNKFLPIAHKHLKDHPYNIERKKNNLLPGNYLLVRGAGMVPKIPTFRDKYGLKSVCIAGAGLYKGIAKIVGMDTPNIENATGKADTDLIAKIDAIKERYDDYDFFFLHIKATDNFGHDGDFEGKTKFIEKIDKALGKLFDLKDAIIIFTSDHSTPCSLKAHSADNVPVTIFADDVRDDDVEAFTEKDCAEGRLGHIKGMNLMPIIIDLMGISEIFGA
ncbi:MAG TPA: 2,3-bisphosphoglycerate-independent phosphoglycerate mutase [bacterium]|nr:2,3-bisphosphoglycerate-independent phosphoglycerate mutase [bacterium]